MPDILAAAEWAAKAVRKGAQIAAEQIAEIRIGFSDFETGDYVSCAGADALADTFGEWGDAVTRDEPVACSCGGNLHECGCRSEATESDSAAPGVAADRPSAACDIPPLPAEGHPAPLTVLKITAVLGAHAFWPANHNSIGIEGHCLCGERPDGLMAWREHVAPLIAGLFARPVETGIDIGGRHAAEFFPQHSKRTK